jgi:hypothetical protein
MFASIATFRSLSEKLLSTSTMFGRAPPEAAQSQITLRSPA